MKQRLLMVAALALAGTVQAATWEYATFTIWEARSGNNYFWTTPDETGVAKRAQGPKLDAINTESNCNVKPLGQLILNERDLFQCFGSRGWELTSTETQALSALTVRTYWFKRPGK